MKKNAVVSTFKILTITFCLFLILISPISAQVRQKIIQESKSSKKISPSTYQYIQKNLKSDADYYVMINNEKEFLSSIASSPIKNKIYYKKGNFLCIEKLSYDLLYELLKMPSVSFIDLKSRNPKEEIIIDYADLSINRINVLQNIYPEINGEGLVVSIKEKPFDPTDIDYIGRVVNSWKNNEFTTHATIMATIIAGAGNSSYSGKGSAWKSKVTTASYVGLRPDVDQELITDNISVQNHSYGFEIDNYYGCEAQQYDIQTKSIPYLVHVFSSGNQGDSVSKNGKYDGIKGYSNITGQFKMSKNSICVGAIDHNSNILNISSSGPAYDGRIKPEIVAYGEGGTSEACAVISGVVLLIQHAYKIINNSLPSSALTKAILTNSAEDVGNPEVDYRSGFGNVNAFEAIKTVNEHRYFSGSITTGDEKIFNITVPQGTNKLKIMLHWNDFQAEVNAETALINDLDIELINLSTGERWNPWVLNSNANIDDLKKLASRGIDRINNYEQITLTLPVAGNYEIHVKGFKIPYGPQEFFITYQFNKGFEWTSPKADSKFLSNTINRIGWQWYETDAVGSIEYQLKNSADWTMINNNISLSKQIYEWNTPVMQALVRFRLKVNNTEYISDYVTVSKAIELNVGFACSDEALLNWNPEPGINLYKVFYIKDGYLQTYMVTSETCIILNSSDLQNLFFTVCPLINDTDEGIKGNTINYTTQGVQCYIKTFVPKDYVTDSEILLELELSSLYKLKSIDFERLENNTFIPINTFIPTQYKYKCIDKNPLPKKNTYRLKITREDNKIIYSSNESVFYNKVNECFIYPNIVKSGQDINIIAGADSEIEIEVYNSFGYLVHKETSESLSIKTIKSNKFNNGVYLVKIYNNSGLQSIGRFIVY